MLPPAEGVSRVSASWRVEAKNAAAEQLKTRLLHGVFLRLIMRVSLTMEVRVFLNSTAAQAEDQSRTSFHDGQTDHPPH